MSTRKPKAELCPVSLRYCARVLRVGAAANTAWAAQPGTTKRTRYGLEVAADDLSVHADSFAIHARGIERARKRKAGKR